MKRIILVAFALWPFNLFGQTDQEMAHAERNAKLEEILQLQDRRTIHDGKLVNFLADKDAVVRERAARAYGSIQDTTEIPLLVDRLADDAPSVAFSAAFAIGQTAALLSKKNREVFQHDLIWARLERTTAADRLIEEIGKFGTEEALRDLVLRFGDASATPRVEALVMSIARFAIRGVTTHEATQYIIKLVKPADRARWREVYALQRIGDKKEVRYAIDDIVQLYKNNHPLVRMNLAALLGKLKDERSSIEPLLKLSEFDGDWRVRVSALKALGNFNLNGKDEALRTFRRAFTSDNSLIALTALATIGNSGARLHDSTAATKELLATLKRIAVNENNDFIWQLQAEAATALAKLQGPAALPLIHPTSYPQRLLQSALLIAMGLTGAPEALATLTTYLNDDDRVLQRAALEGLQELSKKNPGNISIVSRTLDAALSSLDKNDVAIVTTAASILGDSLFLRTSSVDRLVRKFDALRVPDDVEAMQEIASTLGKLKDVRALQSLERQLDQRDRSVALASAAALRAITGNDYRVRSLSDYEPVYTDFDFKYLRELPETVHVKMETIRGDLTMDLYKNAAPFTVMSFLKLATQKGYYRGLTFHRVVPNFVVQGGDPRGDGWGGPGYSIRSEFSSLTYDTGTLGIASAGKDTEGSQFFIAHSPQPHLDGRYTIFGKVTAGMSVADKILLDDHIYDVKVVP